MFSLTLITTACPGEWALADDFSKKALLAYLENRIQSRKSIYLSHFYLVKWRENTNKCKKKKTQVIWDDVGSVLI